MIIQTNDVTFENKGDEINVIQDDLLAFSITPDQLINIAMMLDSEIEKEKEMDKIK